MMVTLMSPGDVSVTMPFYLNHTKTFSELLNHKACHSCHLLSAISFGRQYPFMLKPCKDNTLKLFTVCWHKGCTIQTLVLKKKADYIK
jgi:hypothetical protein